MTVQFQAEGVEVSADVAAKVARIADLNDIAREAEAEGKRLKAEVVEVVGGAEMVAVFPEGIRVTHEGVALATVKPQTRSTISAESLAAQVAAILAANPEIAESHPEVVAAMLALPESAAKVTTFPVVRTK
jgi:hypothetical protein